MPLTEFFVGPRKTILKSDELLVDIVIPKKNLGKPAEFLKFGLRKGQALALVNVAAASGSIRQRHVQGAADRAWRGGADRHSRAEGRSLSRGPRDHAEAMAEAGRIAATEASRSAISAPAPNTGAI